MNAAKYLNIEEFSIDYYMQQASHYRNLSSKSDDGQYYCLVTDSRCLSQTATTKDMSFTAETSAYVVGTAEYLSTMLHERSELLGSQGRAINSANFLDCWGQKQLAFSTLPAPLAPVKYPAGINEVQIPDQEQCGEKAPEDFDNAVQQEISESRNSAEVHSTNLRKTSKTQMPEGSAHEEDNETLCLTSKYIVLEESIPDTVNSSDADVSSDQRVCEVSALSSDEDEEDGEEEDEDSKYELFDDVSVLTADSSMEAIDTTDKELPQEMKSLADKLPCSIYESKSHSIPILEEVPPELICGNLTANKNNVLVDPAAEQQLEKACEASASVAHATQDLHLMSFLLDFCADSAEERG